MAERDPAWLEWLTRVGYAAKGIVYVLIGATGLLVAAGLSERARGSSGVIRLIAGLPMGRAMLAALVVGLVGYALLSLVAAVRAPEGAGGVSGALARAADGMAGIIYVGLAALAVRLLADPTSDTAVASERWAARLLATAAGPVLLGLAGVVAAGAGVYLARKAATLPATGFLDRRRVSVRVVAVVRPLARVGIAARAVLFALCGWLLVRASWTREPRRLGGLGDALDALADAPAGRAAVGVVAAGCVAYGAYQLAKARYRRVRLATRPPSTDPPLA